MPTFKFSVFLSACALFLGATATSHAEYVGPSAPKPAESVAQILTNPRDGQRVVLRGYLIKQVSTEKYMFSDGTGEIRAEIDAEDFRGLMVDAKTRIEIIGEVEKDFLESPEIDVEVISASPK